MPPTPPGIIAGLLKKVGKRLMRGAYWLGGGRSAAANPSERGCISRGSGGYSSISAHPSVRSLPPISSASACSPFSVPSFLRPLSLPPLHRPVRTHAIFARDLMPPELCAPYLCTERVYTRLALATGATVKAPVPTISYTGRQAPGPRALAPPCIRTSHIMESRGPDDDIKRTSAG